MYALVDCNNFYASCERVFNPSLEGRPIAVLSNNDGCVIARSNEAKELGIEMSAPAYKIEHLFKQHNVVVFSSNYTLYGDMSWRVMQTLKDFSSVIEYYSIDEAFLRFDEHPDRYMPIGHSIRSTIKKHVGLPVSVGIAPTKTLAKIANKLGKKHNGVFYLDPNRDIDEYLSQVPVTDIWGIALRNGKKLQNIGIKTALDLKRQRPSLMRSKFTVVMARIVLELQGIPAIKFDVNPAPKRETACTRSFGNPVYSLLEMREAIAWYSSRACEKLRRAKQCANAITVFLQTNQYSNTPQYTNQRTVVFPVPTNLTNEVINYSIPAIEAIFREGYKYNKAGVIMRDLVPHNPVQADIFDKVDRRKNSRLLKAIDRINEREGRDTIRFAVTGVDTHWKLKAQRKSKRYTTDINEILTVKA